MTDLKKIGAIFAAVLLVVSAGGVAAESWDTETTTTATTSDVTSATTSVDYRPGNASDSVPVEINGTDTHNYTVKLVTDGELNYTVYENASGERTPGPQSSVHVRWNITGDELGDTPRDVDGATYDVRVINQSNNSVALNNTVTFNNGKSTPKAVMHVSDVGSENARATTNLVSDRLALSTEDRWIGNDTQIATWSGYTTINGTETVTEAHLTNSSAADAYDAAAKDVEDGGVMLGATLSANGLAVPIYKSEAPDDVEGAYAVYNADTDVLTFHPAGEDYQDVQTLQLRGAAGQSYDFWTVKSLYGWGSALKVLF